MGSPPISMSRKTRGFSSASAISETLAATFQQQLSIVSFAKCGVPLPHAKTIENLVGASNSSLGSSPAAQIIFAQIRQGGTARAAPAAALLYSRVLTIMLQRFYHPDGSLQRA